MFIFNMYVYHVSLSFIVIYSFFSFESLKLFFLFLTDKNRCLKANAKSCGDCIQAGPNCGWCTNTVRFLILFDLFSAF